MNITEKLGIKRIETVRYSDDETPWVAYNPKDIEQLEQQRNEMLEALIGAGITNHWFSVNMQRAVENVAGITWKEIKELL